MEDGKPLPDEIPADAKEQLKESLQRGEIEIILDVDNQEKRIRATEKGVQKVDAHILSTPPGKLIAFKQHLDIRTNDRNIDNEDELVEEIKNIAVVFREEYGFNLLRFLAWAQEAGAVGGIDAQLSEIPEDEVEKYDPDINTSRGGTTPP